MIDNIIALLLMALAVMLTLFFGLIVLIATLSIIS